jgi:hypothetical protein
MATHVAPGRIGRAAGAVLLAGCAGGWAAARRASSASALGLLVVLAVAVLVGGVLARRAAPVAAAAALLGAVFVCSQIGQPASVGLGAVFAVALLAVIELAFSSVDLAAPVTWDRRTIRQRWLGLAGLCAGGAAAALVTGVTATAGRSAGTWLFALGALGAAGILALLAIGGRALNE